MPTYGPKLATVGTTPSFGEWPWSNPSNVGSTSSFATSDLTGETTPFGVYESYITTGGISATGTNQAPADTTTTSAVDLTIGGASSLWGRSWVLADVKANSNFGLLFAVLGSGTVTDRICAKGFDFSEIPDGETIVGAEFKLEWKHTDPWTVSVRNVRCTVTTSGGGGGGGGTANNLLLLGVG